MKQYRTTFFFAGGGTGGHLYPAIAIAEALKASIPDAEICFFGRADKIEGRVVPQYGFRFINIDVEGFSRKNMVRNLRVIVKFVLGIFKSLGRTISSRPIVTVTTGAYISAPVIVAARIMGSRIIMIEPNSFPGMTTRLFERFADEIHLTFEDTKKYLRQPEKWKLTGNPIRLAFAKMDSKDAKLRAGYNPEETLIVVTGGSLGAKKMNASFALKVNEISKPGINILWQTGAGYYEEYKKFATDRVRVVPFIDDMATVMNAADILVCRAGATTIAEIAALGKAAILIPSINVAENHQYFNARSLADKNAAILIEEKDMDTMLAPILSELTKNKEKIEELSTNVHALSSKNASKVIADSIMTYVNNAR
ncbi:MAG: undecaprenyldiphospho-muramoylpentapeptide beta-N-acetylglucosaminyltransferase [Ignavibacteria bacterium]|nr:undecaprenyldiphospho-muramoylpentapeptide beta-N-acetylglucosaminyltransferase [Ignavibacteria bacterium]